MSNKVVHFEIIGTNATGLQSFYSNVFGWRIDAGNPLSYGMVSAADAGLGGGVGPTQDGSTRTMIYIGTDDLQATLDAVEAAGGRTIMPPMNVPGGPVIAMFTDPDGNLIGLMKNA